MIKKITLLLFIGLFTLTTNAQIHHTKTEGDDMSLAEAVVGQYFQFRPKSLFGFEWIKEQNKYSYLKDFQTLVVEDVSGKEVMSLHINDVNSALETEFFYFAGLKWRTVNEFLLNQGNTIVIYNVENKTGKVIKLPEDADNITFNDQLEYVAYTKENNLFISPVDTFEEHAITTFTDKNIVSGQSIARSEMGIDGGIFWSPSGQSIAFYQKDETLVADYPLLDINPTPGELKSIKYPMAGQDSERAKLGIYSIKNGTTNYLQAKNGEDYYLTNVTWTPDDQFILLAEVARSQKHIWMQKYTASAEFVSTLFEEKSDTWVEPERPAYFPSKTSNDFVWVSERDGFDNLYYYAFDGTLKAQLTKNKFVLKDVVATHNNEVFFTATGENPLNTLLYKVNIKGKQTLLSNDEGTHDVSINSTGKYIFDQYSSHSIPNRAVIRKASNGKELRELIKAEDPLAEYEFSPAEIKVIQSRGGVDLYTRMIKPKDFDASKKYPVLIYVYGGPHAQLITNSWLDGASLWMQWMANQGYIVFTLDNRGSGNRGVEFEHVIHRKLGEAAVEDQVDGVNYLTSLPYVDADRIAVHGWSFGGFMTIKMMLDDPDIFKVGVAGGPVTDWKYYEVMYGERYMDTPEENPEGYEKASLLNKAGNLKGDLLMIHGSIDPVVVPQHALSLIKKFVDKGIQTDFFMYPMHEHNVSGRDRIHLMQKVLNYILDHN